MAFCSPDLKKAIKVAQDMGLTVTGYEIEPNGQLRIQTAPKSRDNSDDALEAWQRKRHG